MDYFIASSGSFCGIFCTNVRKMSNVLTKFEIYKQIHAF